MRQEPRVQNPSKSRTVTAAMDNVLKTFNCSLFCAKFVKWHFTTRDYLTTIKSRIMNHCVTCFISHTWIHKIQTSRLQLVRVLSEAVSASQQDSFQLWRRFHAACLSRLHQERQEQQRTTLGCHHTALKTHTHLQNATWQRLNTLTSVFSQYESLYTSWRCSACRNITSMHELWLVQQISE